MSLESKVLKSMIANSKISRMIISSNNDHGVIRIQRLSSKHLPCFKAAEREVY